MRVACVLRGSRPRARTAILTCVAPSARNAIHELTPATSTRPPNSRVAARQAHPSRVLTQTEVHMCSARDDPDDEVRFRIAEFIAENRRALQGIVCKSCTGYSSVSS